MFYTLPEPLANRLNTEKALYEVKIENKGDLPSEKLISTNALLTMISAIFTTAILVQEEDFDFPVFNFLTGQQF